MKPIFVIQFGGRISHQEFTELKREIPEGLTNEYHVLVVDGAEYTKCMLFNGGGDDIEDLEDYLKSKND